MSERLIIKYILFPTIFILISSFAFGIVVQRDSHTSQEKPTAVLTDLHYSKGAIDTDVVDMQKMMEQEHVPFKYNSSLGVLEDNYLAGLSAISNNSHFVSAVNSYSGASLVNITWGLSYNYSIQSYGAYIEINVPRNNDTLMNTYFYSSTNGTVYGPQTMDVQDSMHTTYYDDRNYGGYEFYYPGNGIEQNVATTFNPPIYPPSNANTKAEVGLAAWIGLSPYTQSSNPYYILQEGFDGHFNYSSAQSKWIWENWTIFSDTEYGQFGGVINYKFPVNPNNNWEYVFQIYYNSNNTATYEVWISNLTSLYSQPPVSWSYTPMYAQYMTEASATSYGFYQIPTFTNVTFMNPHIWGTNNQVVYLNNLYSQGDYNTYIMNLTNTSDQNVRDSTTTMPGYLSPIMYYNNSNFTYPG